MFDAACDPRWSAVSHQSMHWVFTQVVFWMRRMRRTGVLRRSSGSLPLFWLLLLWLLLLLRLLARLSRPLLRHRLGDRSRVGSSRQRGALALLGGLLQLAQ